MPALHLVPDRANDAIRAPVPVVSLWLTAAEAAEYLRLPSVDALYQRVARGQVKAFRLGRALRFKRPDLDALMVA